MLSPERPPSAALKERPETLRSASRSELASCSSISERVTVVIACGTSCGSCTILPTRVLVARTPSCCSALALTVTAGRVCSSAKAPSVAPSKPTTTAAPSGNNGLRRGATASEINEIEGDWAFNSGFLLFFTSVPLASQLGRLAGIKAGLPNMAFGQRSGAEAATERGLLENRHRLPQTLI